METGLRDLISQQPSEEFRGVYIEGPLAPTRANVLLPGAIGVYSGGSTYNPSQVIREGAIAVAHLKKLDDFLINVESKSYKALPIKELCQLIALVLPDPDAAEFIWDSSAVAGSVLEWARQQKATDGFVYVDRDRGLKESRRENQGILSGGEEGNVPADKVTLFLLRTKPEQGQVAAWWPQIRFPKGRYAFAFAI
jgi:hypothetical protein